MNYENPNLNINGISSELPVEDLVFASCRGGWPESLNKKTTEQQLFIAKSYFNIICENDMSSVDGVKRNPDKVKILLKPMGHDGRVSYYCDRYGLEVDCVLTLSNGDHALIEFKLGNLEEKRLQKIY